MGILFLYARKVKIQGGEMKPVLLPDIDFGDIFPGDSLEGVEPVWEGGLNIPTTLLWSIHPENPAEQNT